MSHEVMDRARSRMLQQFQTKPVVQALLFALCSQIQELRTATIQVQRLRTMETATGATLDALGRIVGQERFVFSYNVAPWVTPDTMDLLPDLTLVVAWVASAPLGTDTIADDPQFRQMIAARVTRNFIKYGSIPEIQTTLFQMFGVNVSFSRVGMMEVQVRVPVGAPAFITDYLDRFFSTEVVEDTVQPPYPATLAITEIVEV